MYTLIAPLPAETRTINVANMVVCAAIGPDKGTNYVCSVYADPAGRWGDLSNYQVGAKPSTSLAKDYANVTAVTSRLAERVHRSLQRCVKTFEGDVAFPPSDTPRPGPHPASRGHFVLTQALLASHGGRFATLRSVIEGAEGSRPADADMYTVLGTLSDTLRELHRRHIAHGNVSLDTIVVPVNSETGMPAFAGVKLLHPVHHGIILADKTAYKRLEAFSHDESAAWHLCGSSPVTINPAPVVSKLFRMEPPMALPAPTGSRVARATKARGVFRRHFPFNEVYESLPEVVVHGAVTEVSDMYALGAAMFVWATGQQFVPTLSADAATPDHPGFTSPVSDALRAAHGSRSSRLAWLIAAMVSRDPNTRPAAVFAMQESYMAMVRDVAPESGVSLSRMALTMGEKIGSGAFGIVHRVRFNGTAEAPDCPFHLREIVESRGVTRMCLKKMVLGDMKPKDIRHLVDEVRILSMTTHPNIIGQLAAFCDRDGILNVIMEYCDHGDMRRQIAKLESMYVRDFLLQCCCGLKWLHDRGILHRDIKLSNILLSAVPNAGTSRPFPFIVKLADMGLSKVVDPDSATVEAKGLLAKTYCGTPLHMAPEVLQSQEYGPAADIWALGVAFYELINGTCPWQAGIDTVSQLHDAVLRTPPPPQTDKIDKDIRDTILWMLSKDAAARPSADDILKRYKYTDDAAVRVAAAAPTDSPTDGDIDYKAAYHRLLAENAALRDQLRSAGVR